MSETSQTQQNHLTRTRLISWQEVRARVPLSRTTIWELRRGGAFPRPIQISPHRIAWRESDVDDWIAARI